MEAKEKVQATPETFKVLITGCSNSDYWYKDNVGKIPVVEDYNKDTFRIPESRNLILKSDCHVIEPVWKVMKDAEEQKRTVEVWNRFNNAWEVEDGALGYYNSHIYRLAPEPARPEYEPYSYEDREKLRGLWVRRKSDGAEFMIMAVYSWGVGTNETCPAYQNLFDLYETLDGQPVGKLK